MNIVDHEIINLINVDHMITKNILTYKSTETLNTNKSQEQYKNVKKTH